MLASYFSHELLPYVPRALTAYLTVSSTHVTACSPHSQFRESQGRLLLVQLGSLPNCGTRRARDPAGSACWVGRWSWGNLSSPPGQNPSPTACFLCMPPQKKNTCTFWELSTPRIGAYSCFMMCTCPWSAHGPLPSCLCLMKSLTLF